MLSPTNQESCSFNQTIFYEIGFVKDLIRVRVLELTDLFDNYSHYAIRFEYLNKETEEIFYSNVPATELESLQFALGKIVDFLGTRSKNYSEVVFKSSEGFETGCYWDKENRKWVAYARFGDTPESILAFNKRDYKTFIRRIEAAKEKIL